MTRAKKFGRIASVLAAIWMSAAADFPMAQIAWLLGEVGCC